MKHPDPPARRASIELERTAYSQRAARAAPTIALIVLGVWVLHRFLPALAWAAVLAIALWPLHRRLTPLLPGNPRRQGTAPLCCSPC